MLCYEHTALMCRHRDHRGTTLGHQTVFIPKITHISRTNADQSINNQPMMQTTTPSTIRVFLTVQDDMHQQRRLRVLSCASPGTRNHHQNNEQHLYKSNNDQGICTCRSTLV